MIKDYLPVKNAKTKFQVRIEIDLLEQVRTTIKQNDLTWEELITACFKDYLKDEKKSKKSKKPQ